MLQTVAGVAIMPVLEALGYPAGMETLLKANAGKALSIHEVRVMLLLQGVASFSAFVLSPIIYHRFFSNENSGDDLRSAAPIWSLGLLLILGLSFSLVNQALYQLNSAIPLPGGEIGDYFRTQSESVKKLTEQLLSASDYVTIALSFVVVVLIPAFGEELFFRGIMQKLWQRAVRNIHWAIWINSFVFAAIHMEFNGLLPRMALSAVFGYLFYWYGSLWLPIIAHAINNALALAAHYLAMRSGLKSSEEISIPYEEILWIIAMTVSLYILKILYDRRPTYTP